MRGADAQGWVRPAGCGDPVTRTVGGLTLTQTLVQTVLHVGLRRGDAAAVDPTLGRLLGRRPRTVADVIADHTHLWRPEG